MLFYSEFIFYFCPEPLYIDDLEALLDEGMLSFNLEIQDGSVEEVCIFPFIVFKIFNLFLPYLLLMFISTESFQIATIGILEECLQLTTLFDHELC